MADQGGFAAKVLEEAGRRGGAVKINDKPVPQRTLYYLMVFETGGEVLGFEEHKWLEYAKAVRLLKSKQDQQMLRAANKLKKKLDRERKKEEAKEKLLAELALAKES